MSAVQLDLYKDLPTETLEALDRYLERGIHPGDAMVAVLRNDLRATLAFGDEAFVAHMPALVRYLYGRCPSGAWGCPERVTWWLEIATANDRDVYLTHNPSHREYMKARRQQAIDFVQSCRDNDKA